MKRLARFWELFPSSHYVLLSLLFFAGLEAIIILQQWVILSLLIFVVLIAVGIVLIRLEEGPEFHLSQAILPMMAATGMAGFALFIAVGPLLHLYFVVASLTFFFLLKHGVRRAYPTWNQAITIVLYFLNVAVILGMRWHLQGSILLTLVLIWTISFAVGWQFLRRVSIALGESLLVATAMALALGQIGWALLFLPTHYVIQAGVLVTIYYFLFHVVSIAFERKLTRRDMLEYGSIGIVGLIIIFSVARWT